MSNPEQTSPKGTSGFSRRAALVQIGAGLGLTAASEGLAEAQQATAAQAHAAHVAAQAQTTHAVGTFMPKGLNSHEYATLDSMAEWIVPGAHANGSAQFIDFMCSVNDEMKVIYTGGLAWIDDTMRKRTEGSDFLHASKDQQKALLDVIAFRENHSPETGPGIRFFDWTRRMVVDSYYTSAQGIKEVGYIGNTGMATFSVPQEAVDYVMKRIDL
jgi:hypothetical protein